MLVLTWIRKIYKTLSADASPSAIAFGAAFGLTAGCVPLSSGAFLVLVAILLVLRVQISAGLLFFVLGRVATLGCGEAVFYPLGDALLYAEPLMGFWTWLLNAPGFAWSGFAYPAVLGGFVFGASVGAALFLPLCYLVIAYRRWAHDRLQKNRFFRWITGFWLTKILKWVLVGGNA